MFCPVLENQIQQHKKDIERARTLARSGFCYFEVKDKSDKDFISNIVKMDCGEYHRKIKALSGSKSYKTVNGYWGTLYNDVKEQYDTDIELDCPVITNINYF
ncbi:hypothetical protein BF702P1_00049 [Bacteroides phage BF702P1]|nr:hypothetical protein BF702P1_00049 [Bacteroides phage BF702P1]